MGLHSPGFARLALTLILGLGSLAEAMADELIPADIAFVPLPQEDLPSQEELPTPAEIPATTSEPTPDTAGTSTPAAATDTVDPVANIAPETLVDTQNCSPNTGLRKSLTIGSFTRVDPQTANPGNLYEAEQGIATRFQQHLRNRAILTPELLPQGAAHTNDEHQRQRQAQQIARRMSTQFVLQGFITDMSMDNPDSLYNPGLYRKTANWFHDLSGIKTREKRYRQFAFAMELRDGYTGEALLAKTYRTRGVWSLRTPTGFNSARFRSSDYAQAIDALIKEASEELAQTIACQPFIASIDAPPGRTQILLAGGANNGLHAGDQLDLYQLVVSPSNTGYMLAETRLVKRNSRVQLTEVYPSHSTATLLEGEYLNGTFLAISD